MNVRVLPSFDGMVFEFPDRQYRTFWNKNTYMDLDLYWMNDDVVVGKSVLPSIEHSSLTIIRTSRGKSSRGDPEEVMLDSGSVFECLQARKCTFFDKLKHSSSSC